MKFDVVSNIYEWNEGGLNGVLHIELDGSPFPQNSWAGSVSETLIMWAENLLSILDTDASCEEEFFFLDSPYSFTVRQRGASPALLNLLENAKPLEASPVEASFFNVLSAISYLIDSLVCDARFEAVQQVKRLKNIAARLKKASEAHGYHIE